MAENNLDSYRADPPVTADTRRKIAEHVASSKGQQVRLESAKDLAEVAVKDWRAMSWGRIDAQREGNKIELRWEIFPPLRPERYHAAIMAADLDYSPEIENIGYVRVANGNGQGKKTLELEEGHCYFFLAVFISDGDGDKMDCRTIGTKVMIPLSSTSQELLRAGRRIAKSPTDRMRVELASFRETQDAFDEICSEEIEKIKAKGLAPDEEQEQIADFMDFAKQVRAQNQT